jgi:hypothetical protein
VVLTSTIPQVPDGETMHPNQPSAPQATAQTRSPSTSSTLQPGLPPGACRLAVLCLAGVLPALSGSSPSLLRPCQSCIPISLLLPQCCCSPVLLPPLPSIAAAAALPTVQTRSSSTGSTHQPGLPPGACRLSALSSCRLALCRLSADRARARSTHASGPGPSARVDPLLPPQQGACP